MKHRCVCFLYRRGDEEAVEFILLLEVGKVVNIASSERKGMRAESSG